MCPHVSIPCRPLHREGYPSLVIGAITGFPYKITLLIIFTVEQKGHLHHNFLLHFWTKARPRWWCNCWYQVGAACRLLWYNQLAKLVPWPWGIPAWGRGAHAGYCSVGHQLLYDGGPPVGIKVSPHPGLLQKVFWPAALTAAPWHCRPAPCMALCANYSAFIHQAAGGGNDGSGMWANLLPLAVRSPSSQHIRQQTLPGRLKTPEKAP